MRGNFVAAAVVGGLVVHAAALASPQKSGSTQPSGSATGVLTIGSSKIQLAHAYAFPEKGGAYRILVTNQRLSAAAVKFASSAGANDEARQELVLELAETKVFGIEAVVGADKRVTRANIYSAEAVMGMMLLAPVQFEATAFDAKGITGKLSTDKPIEDARIGKTVRIDVSFSATPHGSR